MSADGSDDWLNNLPPPPPDDCALSLYVGDVELTEDGVALAFTRAHKGRALFDQDATPRGDPATYFFYHEGHPSTAVQRIVADELRREILAAAPGTGAR